jgi:hypothetical protein
LSNTGALRKTREARLRTFLALALLCAVCISPVTAAPQRLVVFEKPFHSRSLSGFVLDYSHAPIPDALVEECTENWDSCFAQTRTDQRGRFSWPGVKGGKHFLKISSPGFDPAQIIVMVSWHSKAEFRLKLTVAA